MILLFTGIRGPVFFYTYSLVKAGKLGITVPYKFRNLLTDLSLNGNDFFF